MGVPGFRRWLHRIGRIQASVAGLTSSSSAFDVYGPAKVVMDTRHQRHDFGDDPSGQFMARYNVVFRVAASTIACVLSIKFGIWLL